MTHHKLRPTLVPLALALGVAIAPAMAQEELDLEALRDAMLGAQAVEETSGAPAPLAPESVALPEDPLPPIVGSMVFPTTQAELLAFTEAHMPSDDRVDPLTQTCELIKSLGLDLTGAAFARCEGLDLTGGEDQ